MAGVKGRSGRKSARVEKNKMQALEKAWKRINETIETADVERIALPIALKDMATKVADPDGNKLEVQPILVKFLDDKPKDNRDTD